MWTHGGWEMMDWAPGGETRDWSGGHGGTLVDHQIGYVGSRLGLVGNECESGRGA